MGRNSTITLRKGTLLMSVKTEQDPEIMFQECEESGKTGCYLTDSAIIAFGTINEKKDISRTFWIHTYQVTRNIILSKGKYEFRNSHPERYFDKNGIFIPNVQVLEYENESHYDYVIPILDFDFEDKNEYLEIFITTLKQKKSLNHIRSDKVQSTDVPEIFRNNFKDYEHLIF